MTWSRKDDGARKHPKCVKAGNEAAAFWAWAIEYSNEVGSDGFLDESILHTIPPIPISPKRAKALSEKCVEAWIKPGGAGLFEHADGGYRIHDFHHYQPKAIDKSLSDKRREAGRLGGLRSGETRRTPREASDEPNEEANLKQVASFDEADGSSPSRAGAGARRVRDRDPGSESGDPEGGAGGNPESGELPVAAPAVERIGDLLGELAKAYADGIAEAAGEPWQMPDPNAEVLVLRGVIQLHRPNLRGDSLLAWVKRSAMMYRRALADEWQYQRGFRPSKWQEWLNAGGEKLIAKRPVGNPDPRKPIVQRDEGQPRLWQRGPTIVATGGGK